MITLSDYCKKEYGTKLYKLSLSAGMSCPNRDGTCGFRGCIFCSEGGSGDFSVDISRGQNMTSDSAYNAYLDEQFCKAKTLVSNKYTGDKYIAYFQAYTNTYASIEYLRSVFIPVINREDVAVLSIATRPDCINDDVLALLCELNKTKPVWVELGLQTIHEKSVEYIRRGYANNVYTDAVERLRSIGIHVITHVILYLPDECVDDMLSTVKFVVEKHSAGIKLSLLHVLKNTDLAADYYENHFYIPSLEEYADTLSRIMEVIPEDMVIHRLTGDAPKALLIEPLWTADKKKVLNYINKKLH